MYTIQQKTSVGVFASTTIILLITLAFFFSFLDSNLAVLVAVVLLLVQVATVIVGIVKGDRLVFGILTLAIAVFATLFNLSVLLVTFSLA